MTRTPHLTPDELARWRDHGDARDRDRVMAHLAECDQCGAALRELVRTRPASRDLPVPLDEVVEAGLGARRPAGSEAVGRPRPWRAMAIAAVLVIAVGGVFLAQRIREARRLDAITGTEVRSADIQPLSPAGTVAKPFSFRWTSPVDASLFRLEVSRPEGPPFFSTTTNASTVDPPPDLEERLQPGADYSWRVVALDAAGQPIVTSRAQPFTVQ